MHHRPAVAAGLARIRVRTGRRHRDIVEMLDRRGLDRLVAHEVRQGQRQQEHLDERGDEQHVRDERHHESTS